MREERRGQAENLNNRNRPKLPGLRTRRLLHHADQRSQIKLAVVARQTDARSHHRQIVGAHRRSVGALAELVGHGVGVAAINIGHQTPARVRERMGQTTLRPARVGEIRVAARIRIERRRLNFLSFGRDFDFRWPPQRPGVSGALFGAQAFFVQFAGRSLGRQTRPQILGKRRTAPRIGRLEPEMRPVKARHKTVEGLQIGPIGAANGRQSV